MKKPDSIVLSIFLAEVLTVPAAVAGIVDSAINTFPDGTKAIHQFSVPGVMASQGGLETVFMCTSMEKTKNINIGVEVFDTFGGDPLNDISASEGIVEGVGSGRTVTFETDGAVSATAFTDGIDLHGNPVAQGSARIVSTSAKIICSAMLMSGSDTPPTSMVNLQVIKKRNQKGD